MAKILVVEDEPVPRMILAKLLTRDGHEVQTATGASEAIDTARNFKPELLIADWILPDRHNGQYVAEQLRQVNPALHVLFFTGLPTHKLEKELGHLHPFRFLEKPCDFEAIRSAVNEALNGAQPSSSTN
jgi:DNA-binding NtrC family response regulator